MKTVLEMAKEVWSAGGVYVGPSEKSLAQFAELVRSEEREACAKLVEENAKLCDKLTAMILWANVDAIRARTK